MKEPGRIGECVQDELLGRLVEMFSPPPAGTAGMTDWIQADPNPDDPDECRPCALPITLTWYLSELKETGNPELAASLASKGGDGTPLDVAAEMDRIKTVVPSELRERLAEFDATTQANA